MFGYAKVDVMFGRTTPDAIRLPYSDIVKPGVRFLRETITSIDPEARRVFAEGAARVVAASVLAELRRGEPPDAYDGRGSCYIEFGGGRVGRVDIDFLSQPKPTGTFREPSAALVAEKHDFGASRGSRWFGR